MKSITAIGVFSLLPLLTAYTLFYFGTHRLKSFLAPVRLFQSDRLRPCPKPIRLPVGNRSANV